MSSIDAVGNIHDRAGKFAGHVRGEGPELEMSGEAVADCAKPKPRFENHPDWAVEGARVLMNHSRAGITSGVIVRTTKTQIIVETRDGRTKTFRQRGNGWKDTTLDSWSSCHLRAADDPELVVPVAKQQRDKARTRLEMALETCKRESADKSLTASQRLVLNLAYQRFLTADSGLRVALEQQANSGS